jgi:SAM-dependent methyltransferase
MSVAADDVKACCAAAYSTAAARFLLGDSFHPGGQALTAELVAALGVGVGAGATVVDVATGPGTSALQLARTTGCEVIGIDLAPPPDPPGEPRVRFLRGDAEALPLDDGSVDGALCECALCTFPDKQRAAAELARVLRPGARLALSDMTAERSQLPAALTSLQAWVACIADARPLAEVAALLEHAGFEIERAEQRDRTLVELLDRIEARLRLAGMMHAGISSSDVAEAGALVEAARHAVGHGALGYGIVVARR